MTVVRAWLGAGARLDGVFFNLGGCTRAISGCGPDRSAAVPPGQAVSGRRRPPRPLRGAAGGCHGGCMGWVPVQHPPACPCLRRALALPGSLAPVVQPADAFVPPSLPGSDLAAGAGSAGAGAGPRLRLGCGCGNRGPRLYSVCPGSCSHRASRESWNFITLQSMGTVARQAVGNLGT